LRDLDLLVLSQTEISNLIVSPCVQTTGFLIALIGKHRESKENNFSTLSPWLK